MSQGDRLNRRMRVANAIRKVPPASLAPPDSYPAIEIAAMMREIGVALSEVAQPIPIVQGRLEAIAAKYTTQPVRLVVLPTVLLLQI